MKKNRTWVRWSAVVFVKEDTHRNLTILTLSTGEKIETTNDYDSVLKQMEEDGCA